MDRSEWVRIKYRELDPTVDTFADIRDHVRASLQEQVDFWKGDTIQGRADVARRNALGVPPLNPARRPMERWAICALFVAAGKL
jgi:hypothetical protein